MAKQEKTAKRIVLAPSSTGAMSTGEVLSVEIRPNEDVEWVWSHDRERGSSVTGFRIVQRPAEHQSSG